MVLGHRRSNVLHPTRFFSGSDSGALARSISSNAPAWRRVRSSGVLPERPAGALELARLAPVAAAPGVVPDVAARLLQCLRSWGWLIVAYTSPNQLGLINN